MAGVSGKTDDAENGPMRDSIARFERRRRRWRVEGARTLVLAVTVVGVGWTIVVPAVAGFALGHWLDGRHGTGIVLSAGLGLLGLALGCYGAWRHIARQRDDPEEQSGHKLSGDRRRG